jgi:DNA-binding transcriptional regulator YdaS (Cro superfamily)
MTDDDIFDSFEQELIWLINNAGGVNALARQLELSSSAISHWLRRTRKPSAHHAINIEAYTNGAIPRERIRPDLFAAGVILKNRADMTGFKPKKFKEKTSSAE